MADDVTPSGREMDVLKVLWELRSGSVREVHQRLCLDRELAFTTVQTLLRIMEEKGLVEHRAEGRAFIYSPRQTRERVAARFLDKVFDGALDQFVLSILEAKDADPAELRDLEQLIAKARREKQARPKEET